MQRVKKFLLFLSFVAIVAAIFFLLIIVPFIEQFTDLISLAGVDIESDTPLNNFTLIFPIYYYKGEPFKIDYILGESPRPIKNLSIIDTKYGKMWMIKAERINKGDRIPFAHPYTVPIDLFDLELKPVLNESVIKDERRGRYYEKVTNLTIPVYIYYDGNDTTVKITYLADSGQDNLLGLIPIAPKYKGEVYAGTREDVFVIKSKGWKNITGTSHISLVYQ